MKIVFHDISTASKISKEHSFNIHWVFKILSHFGIKVNVKKYIFGPTKSKFFGCILDKDGILPLIGKGETVDNFLLLPSVQQRHQSCEMLSYRRFISNWFFDKTFSRNKGIILQEMR